MMSNAPPIVIPFDIQGDGRTRTLNIDLSGHSKYRDGMTQIKLRLPPGPGKARIHSVLLLGDGRTLP